MSNGNYEVPRFRILTRNLPFQQESDWGDQEIWILKYKMKCTYGWLLLWFACVAHCKEDQCVNGVTKVIVDADTAMWSTFGLDIDDDLAIAYLFAHPCAEIIGITVTHGNAMISSTCPGAIDLIDGLYKRTQLTKPKVTCGSG